MRLIQKLHGLQSQTKARAIALFLIVLVGFGLFEWRGYDLAFMLMIIGIYALGAVGLAFRWGWFRLVALFPVALTVAICFWGVVINAALAIVSCPSLLPAVFWLAFSTLIGVTSVISAVWLNSTEAKAYFSNAET